MRWKSSLGLFCCWLFLAGNIAFDKLDKPTLELQYDPGEADSRWFFIPLMILVSVLIYLAYDNYKHLGSLHKSQWKMFFALSIPQLIKNIIFDATVTTINDYISLAIFLVWLLFTLFKNTSIETNSK